MLSSILPDGIKLSANETVAVDSTEYLDELQSLVKNTSVRTLVNFMIWRVVDKYSGLLGATKKYINDTRPRSSRCFEFTLYSLPISLNAHWVRSHLNRNAKSLAIKLVASIKEEFKKLLESVDWLDNKTRAEALQKANRMSSLVGYPDEFLDDEKLMQVYENMTVDESKFFEAVLKLNTLDVYEGFRNLHAPINKTDWITHSFVAVVNAFYFATENNIRKFIDIELLDNFKC